ncbi:MAG: hypothetical protein ACFFDS_05915 [Candidatus Thorarchaeota archaeon]
MDINEFGDKLSEEIDKEIKKAKKKSSSDAEEVREILGVVSTQVPDLLKNIFGSIYDPSIAVNYGKGIGSLYKELQEQGLPEEMVREIVLNFSKSFDFMGTAMKSIPQGIDKNGKIKAKIDIENDEEDD